MQVMLELHDERQPVSLVCLSMLRYHLAGVYGAS